MNLFRPAVAGRNRSFFYSEIIMAEQNTQFLNMIFHDSRDLLASFDKLRIIFIVEGSCNVILPQ